MTEPGDTMSPTGTVVYLGVDRARISSLQQLLIDLADFFDLADQHVCDAAAHHFDIGDADGWLAVVLTDNAQMLADALIPTEAG
jgi:hypothetical protein